MSIREKIFDLADRADRAAFSIAGSAFKGTSIQERAFEYCKALQDFSKDLSSIAKDSSLPDQSELLKLRQAVRDLTASSEKLRQINQKSTQKALQAEQVIQRA